MQPGKWLAPRYPNRAVFEKDYPDIDLRPLEVYCPGCKNLVFLNRKAKSERIGGWCKKCDRAVGT